MKRLRVVQEGERTASVVEFAILALVVGVLTGGGAVLFRAFIAFIHNLAYLGQVSFYYDPNLHTPMGWLGPLVMASPAIGGIVVIFLIRRQPEDRRGQGVSDIIDAIYYREGRVRAVSAMVKSLAAGIQSATGGSVGREAAIVQIGAALASRISRITGIAQWQRMTLVAAGGAAGLAAAFNAPLGSIVFAIELMMPEISPRTLLPVTIATGAGTFVARFYLRPAADLPGADRSPPRACASRASSRCCRSCRSASCWGCARGFRSGAWAGSSGSSSGSRRAPICAT